MNSITEAVIEAAEAVHRAHQRAKGNVLEADLAIALREVMIAARHVARHSVFPEFRARLEALEQGATA